MVSEPVGLLTLLYFLPRKEGGKGTEERIGDDLRKVGN